MNNNIVCRKTKIGDMFINTNNLKILLKTKENVIEDQLEIYKLLEEHRVPFKAHIELTGNCNLNCYYCYAKGLRKQQDLTTEQLKKIIDSLYDAGVIILEITGGEPLIRKDFIEILRYINKKGFIVNLFTNALNINEEILSELKNGRTSLISTSLLAPDSEKCDELTGVKGSFERIINSIKLIKNSGIPYRVACCITNENINLYEEYEKIRKKYKFKIIYGIDVDPTYNGLENVKDFRLSENDAQRLKKIINVENITIKDLLPEYRCNAGKNKLCISNNGDFLICYKYREVIGNIVKDDFSKLWSSPKIQEILNNKFKKEDKCKKCEITEYCYYCPGIMSMYEDKSEMCNKAKVLYKLFNE